MKMYSLRYVRSWLFIPIALVILTALTACKIVNTHVVKLTNTPEMDPSLNVLVKSTKGNVYLASQEMSQGVRDMLLHMHPSECLAIRTSEPFNMNDHKVYFKEFTLTKLVQSAPECRKIKTQTRLYIN